MFWQGGKLRPSFIPALKWASSWLRAFAVCLAKPFQNAEFLITSLQDLTNMLLLCLQHSLSAPVHCQEANGERSTGSYITWLKKGKKKFHTDTLVCFLNMKQFLIRIFSKNYLKRLELLDYVVISFWKWCGFNIYFGWGSALLQNPYLQKRIPSALGNAASYSYIIH